MSDFELEIKGEVGIINFTRATIQEVKEFQEHIENLRASNISKIIVNLSEPMFIDSSVIGAMVLAGRELRFTGGDIYLVTPPEGIDNMYAASGISRVFNLFTSVEDAMNSFVKVEFPFKVSE